MTDEIARYRKLQSRAWQARNAPPDEKISQTASPPDQLARSHSPGSAASKRTISQNRSAPEGTAQSQASTSRDFLILDPVGISGPVTLQTPGCVLLEIAEYWGLGSGWGSCEMASPSVRAAVVKQLSALAPVRLPIPLAKDALALLARFVNRGITWKWRELWSAFLELEEQQKEFGADAGGEGCAETKAGAPDAMPGNGDQHDGRWLTIPRLRDMIGGAEVSRPTPGKKTVTVSFLYRAAIWLGVPLYPTVDAASLKLAVEGYLGGYGHFLVACLLIKNADSSPAHRCCLPKTPEAAVEMAAERLSVDLGFTTDPETAYLELAATGFSREVTELKKRNPRLCELDHVYNPRLRYPKALLKKFEADVGPHAPITAIEALVTGESFWGGWYPTISNSATPFLFENVAELGSDEILCFGSVRARLWAFTYGEMLGFFRSLQVPSVFIPEKGTVPLTPAQVSRLGRLLEGGGVEKREMAMELARMTESLMQGERLVSDVFSAYGRGGEEIAEFFECLFVLAMVMRGWSGKKEMPLPVRGAVGESGSIKVEMRTWKTITKVENLAAKVSRGGRVDLLDLPLAQYNGGFQRYASTEGGGTIRERLAIVRQPEKTFACIRLTSNVMAYTALYYMGRVGMSLPVSPEEIKSVA